VENYFLKRLKAIGVVGIVIGLFEIFGAIFAFNLMKAIKKDNLEKI
jgi:hypothetical protein